MNYSVFIQYDPNDEIFVASIPELQGCMAHGKTRQEAIEEIGIVCDMWLQTAREKSLPIPEPALYSLPEKMI